LPEGADGESVVALGQADAMLVGEERRVEVAGRGEVQRALEEDLAGGGFEEVAAADYFCDVGVGVIDHAGELVRRESGVTWVVAKGFTPDEEIAEVFAGYEGLWTEVFVFESDNGFVRNAKAVVDVGLERYFALLYVKSGAEDAWVDGFVVGVFVRRVHHGGEVFAAAMTGVDVSGDEELVERFTVELKALELVEDRRLPLDAEPCEVFEDGFGEVWL
jgi:hypothetical protein